MRLGWLFLLAVSLAGPAAATDFNGTFTWSGDPADRASLSHAVNQAAGHVNFLIRPFVRKRLAAVVVPYTSIELAVSNGVVTFNRNASDQPITATIGGPAVPYVRSDGKLSDVTFVRDGEKIRQTYSNDEGSRENLFSMSPDGRVLTMEVSIKPAIIDSSIDLIVTYVKEPR